MLHAADHTAPANIRADAASLALAKRLEAIGSVVSSLDVSKLENREEVTRALCILELANKCIQVVLSEIQGSFVRDSLIDQSESLIKLIDLARSKVASFRLA